LLIELSNTFETVDEALARVGTTLNGPKPAEVATPAPVVNQPVNPRDPYANRGKR
jgi:hypothetical protein